MFNSRRWGLLLGCLMLLFSVFSIFTEGFSFFLFSTGPFNLTAPSLWIGISAFVVGIITFVLITKKAIYIKLTTPFPKGNGFNFVSLKEVENFKVRNLEETLRQAEIYNDNLNKSFDELDKKTGIFLGIAVAAALGLIGFLATLMFSTQNNIRPDFIPTLIGSGMIVIVMFFTTTRHLVAALLPNNFCVSGIAPEKWNKFGRLSCSSRDYLINLATSYQGMIDTNKKTLNSKADHLEMALNNLIFIPMVLCVSLLYLHPLFHFVIFPYLKTRALS